MKMFVWSNHHSYLVVAHAETVAAAREQLKSELGVPGTLGSGVEWEAMRKHVFEQMPEIWRGSNCEFLFTEAKGGGLER